MIINNQIKTHIKVPAQIPEHVGITYRTTEKMGGDAGHGGYTDLSFFFECGAEVLLQDAKGKKIYSYDPINYDYDSIRITIRVTGDWEYEGMESALKKLGLKLIAKDLDQQAA